MNALVADKMHLVQMHTTRAALKLELLGMTRSRSPSAYILAKRNFGLTGNRQFVLEQLESLIEAEHNKQKRKYHNVHAIK